MLNEEQVISDKFVLRPRYGEVDQMGYVYHANYVSYCHQARTEMLRNLGMSDKILEENSVMLPVISFSIKYLNPVFYDEEITIRTKLMDMPKTRMNFSFEIFNENKDLVSKAESTVVFVDKDSRKPRKIPEIVQHALEHALVGGGSFGI